MKVISSIITLLLILALTACSQNPVSGTPEVDHPSLIRSMAYTHRHLLEQRLGPQIEEEGSEQILLQSHCDLIRRGVVQTNPLPALCKPPVSHDAEVCIARFHRCVGACGTFMKDCPVCEPKAALCLEKVDDGSQVDMSKQT
ncbi:MAG: hypothetical protein V7745_06405 [Pseudomonadales bacterium]